MGFDPTEISSHCQFCPCWSKFVWSMQGIWESFKSTGGFWFEPDALQSAGDSSLVKEAFHILLSITISIICCSVRDILWVPDADFTVTKNWDLSSCSRNISGCCLQPSFWSPPEVWGVYNKKTLNSKTSSECFIALGSPYQLACP